MRAWFSVCQLAAVTPFAPLWLDDVFLLANQRRIMRWGKISVFHLALISWKYRRNFATTKYFCAVLYWSQNARNLTAKDKDKLQRMRIQLMFCACTETGELGHKSPSIEASIHWTEIRNKNKGIFSVFLFWKSALVILVSCTRTRPNSTRDNTLGMYPNAENNDALINVCERFRNVLKWFFNGMERFQFPLGNVANVSECIENVFECILTFRNALRWKTALRKFR